LADRSRDVLCVSATQVGKTYACACWLLAVAWEKPMRTAPYWWTAPTYNQIVQGFRLVTAIARSAGILDGNPFMTPYPRLRLINGSQIEFRSWEREQNLMGTTIAGGVVDEAGLLTPEAQAAISTRRSSTLGPLRYIGNPGLVAGPFRRLCSLAEQGRNVASEWAGVFGLHRWTWQDKHDALAAENPTAAREYATFIRQEKASLPEFEFLRLYEAEWTEDQAAVFRGLDRCIEHGDSSLLPAGSDVFAVGVDVAQSVDYLAVVSYAQNAKRLELRHRARGQSYQHAAQIVDGIVRDLGAVAVVEDNGPGVALIAEMQRLGTPMRAFTTTAQSKQELILSLAADVQEVRIRVADHAPLPYEMAIYRYERTQSGMYRYTAPAGEHDDTVMAAAFARWGASRRVDLSGYGWA
jgi:hypothetical protein